MKHHFGDWSTDRSKLGGLAKVAVQPGDSYTHCTRCGVLAKVQANRTTTKFWSGGTWVKKAPCEPKSAP